MFLYKTFQLPVDWLLDLGPFTTPYVGAGNRLKPANVQVTDTMLNTLLLRRGKGGLGASQEVLAHFTYTLA